MTEWENIRGETKEELEPYVFLGLPLSEFIQECIDEDDVLFDYFSDEKELHKFLEELYDEIKKEDEKNP